MEANDRRMLEEWRSRDPRRPLYLWLYYNFPALNAKYDKYGYFPGFFARTVVSQMDLYRKANIQGVFMEHSSEFGATYLMDQLEFYVTLKLADDPTLDGRQLIDEFFEKYYGHAGPAMRKVYEAIEDVFSDPRKYPPEIQESQSHQHQNERGLGVAGDGRADGANRHAGGGCGPGRPDRDRKEARGDVRHRHLGNHAAGAATGLGTQPVRQQAGLMIGYRRFGATKRESNSRAGRHGDER